MKLHHILQVLVSFVVLVAQVSVAAAQSASAAAPAKTIELRDALASTDWQEVASGIHVLQARSATGIAATAYRFDLAKLTLDIGIQNHPKGERAHQIGERLGVEFAVNAGFFRKDGEDRLFAVGLLNNKAGLQGKAWRKSGGYLVLGDRMTIRPSKKGPPDKSFPFVQSKPALIEPGGNWAMNRNSHIAKRRTLICLPPDGDDGSQTVTIILISGDGMSLFEAGWLMQGTEVGGYFNCDAAIAMDGGGSTQVWSRDMPELSFRGITPVHNFLIVGRR